MRQPPCETENWSMARRATKQHDGSSWMDYCCSELINNSRTSRCVRSQTASKGRKHTNGLRMFEDVRGSEEGTPSAKQGIAGFWFIRFVLWLWGDTSPPQVVVCFHKSMLNKTDLPSGSTSANGTRRISGDEPRMQCSAMLRMQNHHRWSSCCDSRVFSRLVPPNPRNWGRAGALQQWP